LHDNINMWIALWLSTVKCWKVKTELPHLVTGTREKPGDTTIKGHLPWLHPASDRPL
jgi:hypothetical protein